MKRKVLWDMEIEKYRKKPVVIEATRWELIPAPTHEQMLENAWNSAKDIAGWCGGKAVRDEMPDQRLKTYYWSIEIPTLEGTMRVNLGDWIIRGINGEFYPCKPDIFAKTYEDAT